MQNKLSSRFANVAWSWGNWRTGFYAINQQRNAFSMHIHYFTIELRATAAKWAIFARQISSDAKPNVAQSICGRGLVYRHEELFLLKTSQVAHSNYSLKRSPSELRNFLEGDRHIFMRLFDQKLTRKLEHAHNNFHFPSKNWLRKLLTREIYSAWLVRGFFIHAHETI